MEEYIQLVREFGGNLNEENVDSSSKIELTDEKKDNTVIENSDKENDLLDVKFYATCEIVSKKRQQISKTDWLRFYGLYKVAMGDVFQEEKPILSIDKAAKLEAWKSVSHLSVVDAKAKYIELANSLGLMLSTTSEQRNPEDQLLFEFQNAANAIKKAIFIPQQLRVQFYGLYKVATIGPCDRPKPIFGTEAMNRWEAWNEYSSLTKEQAMNEYISLAKEKQLLPSQNETLSDSNELEKLKVAVVQLKNELMDAKSEELTKKGYLFKWRDRQLPVLGGAKWAKKFFILEGSSLKYFETENDVRPSRVISLKKNCIVEYEGEKQIKDGHSFFIFSVKLVGNQQSTNDSGVIVRLSCQEKEEALQWFLALSEACGVSNNSEIKQSEDECVQPNALPAKKVKDDFDPKHFPASRAVHRRALPSFLSHDAPKQNYRGIITLGVIIIIVSNLRTIIENFLRYGLMPILPTVSHPWILAELPVIHLFISLHIFIFACFGIEKIAVQGRIKKESHILALHVIILAVEFLFSILSVWIRNIHPVVALPFLMTAVILWMKLVSYVHVNHHIRVNQVKLNEANMTISSVPPNESPTFIQDTEGPPTAYPENITLSNLYYYLLAPTLCYQLNYPRSSEIRVKYVFSLLFRIVITFGLMIILVTQYINPAVENAIEPLDKGDYFLVFEKLLRIAIPNTYVWLLGFYAFFHLYLNLFAEILRFGDRVFYKDWWNATDLEQYWRLWNLPVHYWLARHIYFPTLRLGFSKAQASFFVFIFSAVFHELLISVPFHMLRLYAFFGMAAQIPLIFITKRLDKTFNNPQIGNVIFWVSFVIVGQPMGVLLYYYDYHRLH